MTQELQKPAPVSESDPRALARYLLSFRWAFRDERQHHKLVRGGLALWRQILDYVPQPAARGRALELGSPPFHITLLLQRFRNYDLSLTGFASDGSPEISMELESPEYGEKYEFRCTCFDAERERFPYPDNSFDLVTWCEVIEHLTENPVHTLSEIHRVLKPGGSLVLSTPNASRTDSIFNLLIGHNLYDPYHLGAPLKGSRHSREYTFEELRELVSGAGFRIDRMQDLDIYPADRAIRSVFRFAMNNVASRITHGHHKYHLFVRAVKTAAPFRWNFPGSLFDPSHLAFHIEPRDARVVMGENELIHTTVGWSDLQAGPDGRAMRRSEDVGDIFIISADAMRQVTVTVSGGAGEAQAWHGKNDTLVLLGATRFSAPDGVWTDVVIPVSDLYRPGERVHVRLEAPGGVNLHSVSGE